MRVKLEKIANGSEIYSIVVPEGTLWNCRLVLDGDNEVALHVTVSTEEDAMSVAESWSSIRALTTGIKTEQLEGVPWS